jgi:hypothetical protein
MTISSAFWKNSASNPEFSGQQASRRLANPAIDKIRCARIL